MNGPVDGLGRSLADAGNCFQVFGRSGHDGFKGGEILQETLGSLQSNPRET